MIDLGHGISGDLVRDRRVCCAEDHAHLGWSGVAVIHPGDDMSDCITDAFWCESRAGDARNIVELGQLAPLTVTGRITCAICGLDGSITKGKWRNS